MAAGNVLPGEGTLFQISIASTMTTIAQVIEVSGVGNNVEPIDKTVLTSTLIITRPSKLAEPEKVTLKIYFDPNDSVGQVILSGDSNAPGTIRDFVIKHVDGNTTKSTAVFSGYVTKFVESGIKVKENITSDVEIQPTTLVTWVAGTP